MSLVDFECPICGQVFCAPVTTICGHTFCRSCLSVWLFEHESSTCPSCRGQLEPDAVKNIDVAADAAARAAFPDEWQARRAAAKSAAHEMWVEQLPFLLGDDIECAKMIRNLESVLAMNQIVARVRPRITTAMLALPRRWFLPPTARPRAYDGMPIRLSYLRFNVSAPEVYAHALELLDIQPGHTILDIGSGCGLLTCLAGILAYPGGSALGIDIRERAVAFAQHNLEKARRRLSSPCYTPLGSPTFEGTVFSGDKTNVEQAPSQAHLDQPGDPDGPRALFRVTADLGGGKFAGAIARCASAAAASRGVHWTPCRGEVTNSDSGGETVTCVRLEETDGATKRTIIHSLKLSADGTLRGTWEAMPSPDTTALVANAASAGANGENNSADAPTSSAGEISSEALLDDTSDEDEEEEPGAFPPSRAAANVGERGYTEFRPVPARADPALIAHEALSHPGLVVFDRRNAFALGSEQQDGDISLPAGRTFDRIHVGATIPDSRSLELFLLLRPGGVLVGPLKERLVVVTRHGSEAREESFTVRPTAAVRYGDLITPEAEPEELSSDRPRRARPPLADPPAAPVPAAVGVGGGGSASSAAAAEGGSIAAAAGDVEVQTVPIAAGGDAGAEPAGAAGMTAEADAKRRRVGLPGGAGAGEAGEVGVVCCRACGAAVAPAAECTEPLDVYGEDFRLDGVGACILARNPRICAAPKPLPAASETAAAAAAAASGDDGMSAERSESPRPSSPGVGDAAAAADRPASFAWRPLGCPAVRAGRCSGCGLFLGLLLDGGVGVTLPPSAGGRGAVAAAAGAAVGAAGGESAGELCAPRALLIRRSAEDVAASDAAARSAAAAAGASGVIGTGGSSISEPTETRSAGASLTTAAAEGKRGADGAGLSAGAEGAGDEEMAVPGAAAGSAAAASETAVGVQRVGVEVAGRALPRPGKAILCAAAGCGARLSWTGQVISERHQWRLSTSGEGPAEAAWFVNALEPGAVREGPAKSHELAQGAMSCAAVHCVACAAEVGWRFRVRGNPRDVTLVAYEGRYGLVKRAIRVEEEGAEMRDTAAAEDVAAGAGFRAGTAEASAGDDAWVASKQSGAGPAGGVRWGGDVGSCAGAGGGGGEVGGGGGGRCERWADVGREGDEGSDEDEPGAVLRIGNGVGARLPLAVLRQLLSLQQNSRSQELASLFRSASRR